MGRTTRPRLLGRLPLWSIALATAIVPALGRRAVAAADEKYALRLQLQPGQVWAFDSSMDTDMTVRAAPAGQPPQNNRTLVGQRRSGTLTVKAVRDGAPTAVVAAFGKDCANVATVDGREESEPWPLAGKAVTLKRAADGRVTNDAEGLDPALAAEVNQLLEMDQSLYPREAVAVGDAWTPDTAKLRQQFQLAADDSLGVRCKLTGVVQLRGRRAYEVGLTGTIAKAQDGMTLRMELGGTMRYDAATGIPLQGNLSARVTVKGEQQAPGPNGPVAVALTGGGTVTMTQSTRLQDRPTTGGAAAGDPSPRRPEGPVAGPAADDPQPAVRSPLDPPRPPAADRPAVMDRPRRPASPYAGLFKGDELAADFEVADGRVTGSITKAGRQFRVTGAVRDDRLVGAFEASGVEFNFSAALEGDTLTFETEGSRYVMKRR